MEDILYNGGDIAAKSLQEVPQKIQELSELYT